MAIRIPQILSDINLAVPRGFSLIANQLNGIPDNTLESILPHPPDNTTIYFFNGSGYDSATFSADNPGWFPPHKVLVPGGGAFIAIDPSQAPSGINLTFVGQVQLSSSIPIGRGFSVLSLPVPVSGWPAALAFPPRENDAIYFFRYVGYNSYSWSADNPGWFPVPNPRIGEAFFLSAPQGSERTWVYSFSVGPP